MPRQSSDATCRVSTVSIKCYSALATGNWQLVGNWALCTALPLCYTLLSSQPGRLAQLVRAPSSHGGGPRFEPASAHHADCGISDPAQNQRLLHPRLMQTVTAAFLLLTCFTGQAGAGPDPHWQLIRPDVQYAAWSVVSAYGSPSVHLLRINLKQANLRPLPVGDFGAAMPVEEFARYNAGVVAIVNANFFRARREKTVPMGLVVQDGRILNRPIKSRAWGIFLIDARRARIVRPAEYKHSRAIKLALQGMPLLLENGRVFKLKAQTAKRTAVGIRPDK